MKKNPSFADKIGLISLLGASIIWGIAYIPTRILGQHNISVFFEIFVRYTIPTILIFILNIKEIMSISKKIICGSFLMGIILFIALSLSIYGLQNITHGSMGMIMMSLYIILVPLVSFVIFKQQISMIIIFCLLLSSIGSLLLSWGDGSFVYDKGTFLCSLASIAYTIYILLSARVLHDTSYAFGVQFYQSITIIACSIPFLIKTDPEFLSKIPMIFDTPSLLWSLIYIGVVAGTMGYILYFLGQKHSNPVLVPIVLSLQSFFAALTDMLFFKIELSLIQIIAYILLLGSFLVCSCNAYIQKKFQDPN
ncbi:MAG: DMT family transporter [Brevinema sp.]